MKRLEICCNNDVPDFRLKIDAPSIEYLKIMFAKVPADLLIENLYSIIRVEIELCRWGIPKEFPGGTGHTAFELLRGLGHVKCLALKGNTTNVSS